MKNWIRTLILAFLLANSPIVYGQENPPAGKDADVIKKANDLHEEASRLLDDHDIAKAIEKETEATKIAPQYWLPHAALGYLYFGRGGPAIMEAAESIRTEHPRLADINLGLLLQYFHLYDDSIKTFKQILEADPNSIPAKVGLASSMIGRQQQVEEGRKLLNDAYKSAPDDPLTLDALARAYFEENDYVKTRELCIRALSLTKDPKLTKRLQKLLLVAAVNTSDLTLIDSLKSKVTDLQPYERSWLKGFDLKSAKTPTDAASVLRFAEAESTSDENWLAYAIILQKRAEQAGSPEKSQWLQLAKSCIDHAVQVEPNNVEIRIMRAAIDDKLGMKNDALKQMLAGWSNAPFEPTANAIGANDKMTKADITLLAKGFVKKTNGYATHLATIEFSLPKVTCNCRYKTFRQMIKPIPGVIEVLTRTDHPGGLVIFDSRKASKESIFDSKAVTGLHETVAVGPEKPVETIADLGDITSQYVPTLAQPSFFAERVTLVFPSVDRKYQSVAGSSSGAVN